MNSGMADSPENFDMLKSREIDRVKSAVVACLRNLYQPSAWELLKLIRKSDGEESLFYMEEAISSLASDSGLSRMERSYLESLLHSGDLFSALNGFEAPGRQVASSIDQLLRQTAAYRSTRDFAEMLRFIARFRKYSPFNNMLVYTQNPSCAFFATEKHWYEEFSTLSEGRREAHGDPGAEASCFARLRSGSNGRTAPAKGNGTFREIQGPLESNAYKSGCRERGKELPYTGRLQDSLILTRRIRYHRSPRLRFQNAYCDS